jgi:ABC-type branched-subunit amino acid transport system ATPase component
MSSTQPLVEARGLVAGYRETIVVRELDVAVLPGEVVALVGPNGAGKTTTMMTLAGELPLIGGEIRFLGQPVRWPLHRRAREGLSFVTEERSVFMRLTLLENLKVAGADLDAALALFPELEAHLHQRVGLLSGGQQQMLALARALARHPKLLLADELSLGLAPKVVDRLLAAVRAAANDRGVGVLLVEQHVRKALDVADRVVVMRRGRVELTGTAAEMRGRINDIQAAYLSQGDTAVTPAAQS